MITEKQAMVAFLAVKGEHDEVCWLDAKGGIFYGRELIPCVARFVFRAQPMAAELVLYVYANGTAGIGAAPAPMTLEALSLIGRADRLVKRLALTDASTAASRRPVPR